LATGSPSPDDVASALAGRDGARLQASGAHAPNLLGLSDQVPVRLTFLTDGRSRRRMQRLASDLIASFSLGEVERIRGSSVTVTRHRRRPATR